MYLLFYGPECLWPWKFMCPNGIRRGKAYQYLICHLAQCDLHNRHYKNICRLNKLWTDLRPHCAEISMY